MRLYGDKALDQKGLAYLWQKILDLVRKSVPTKISQLENDRRFVTLDETTGYLRKEIDTVLASKQGTSADPFIIENITAQLAAKADKVVNVSRGKLAGLNNSGNLIDSGIVGEDVADEELSLTDISNLMNF